MKKYIGILLACLLPLGFVACSDDDEPEKEPVVLPDDDGKEENKPDYYTFSEAYINQFCYEQMSFYYLWWKDIQNNIGQWLLGDDPIVKVRSICYEEDEWTSAIENIKPYTEPSTTTYGTYGYELAPCADKNSEFLGYIVLLVYPDSPAERAGLKRGSIIVKMDGRDIEYKNEDYGTLLSSESLNLTVYNPDTKATEEIKMTATNMYLEPVLYEKVFDCGGKKVGYVFFNDFTFECVDRLIEVAKYFKQEGVSELVLDLRYNRGGYVVTEEILVSLLAPEENVKNGDLYQTAVYNDTEYSQLLKQYFGDDYANTYFTTKFEWTYEWNDENGKKQKKDYSYDTSDANIGLNKIYALVSGSTASASEATLVGLMPFMDIEVIGMQTGGKHCAGMMFEAEEYYQDYEDYAEELKKKDTAKYNQFVDDFWKNYSGWKNYVGNWGLYVMVSTYADKNGNNPCRPDGIIPDVEIKDYPFDPYPLGDDREALLREALTRAGYTDFTPLPEAAESRSALNPSLGELIPWKTEGRRILLKPELPMNLPARSLNLK